MSHGQQLGRYTLIEQLAIGGMAEIWLAHMAGPEGFEKVVVIKKIRPHLAKQKNFLNMFLNEARLAAQLNHPNIVQIYEFGNPEKQHYIAMEYVFGRDLSEIVPKAKRADIPFPLEYAIKIIAQVCEGIYYAHTKADKQGNPLKIIHRDISPQNVLVSFDGHVKILDFGIAKAANQYEQTQQGILKGKVSYMAPEQILGHKVDSRADIFSLGAVFYELITGYKLFSGENELAILRSITEGPIYPPSYFNEDIPEELEEIIMTALAKDPDERYPNAWEMQRALTQLLIQFDFHPTNTHLANFLKQLFEDEIEQESRYLEQKIDEVVRNKASEDAGEESHEELEMYVELDEVEEEVIELQPEDLEPETRQTETPTTRRRLNDTRPDIDAMILSDEDEIPSFEEYTSESTATPMPYNGEATPLSSSPSTPAPLVAEIEAALEGAALNGVALEKTASDGGGAVDEATLDKAPSDAGLAIEEAIEEALDGLHEFPGVGHGVDETPVQSMPKDPTHHHFNSHQKIDFADLPPPPEPEAPHSSPGTYSSVASPTLNSLPPLPREDRFAHDDLPPDADELMSQILFTVRFRTKDYDDLRDLAQYHDMSLEQLIHAMLKCARPFFDAELDLK